MTVLLGWMERCDDPGEPRLADLGIGGALAEAEYLHNEACPDLPICLLAAVYAHHRCRRPEGARRLQARAETLAEEGYFSPAVLSRIRLIMGDREGALEGLEKALEIQDPSLRFATNGVWQRTLRGDPRFETIVDRLGLPRERDWIAADALGIQPLSQASEEPRTPSGG